MNTTLKINLAVIIHTLNEEVNLPYAIQSVAGKFSELYVIDAGSTDKTKKIAIENGATFIQISGNRSTLVKQRNWALNNVNFKSEWVYILDADEIVPNDLIDEIREIIEKNAPQIDGYWVRYKEIFLGKWVKRASIYPNWNLRLFRHKLARYEDRTVNAHVNLPYERTARLKSHFIHDDKRGIISYIKRLSQITKVESQSYQEIYDNNNNIIKGKLISLSPIERRRALKKIYYKLPFRPLIIFFYLYVARFGFLEGKPGLYKALYHSIQSLFINMFEYEKKSK